MYWSFIAGKWYFIAQLLLLAWIVLTFLSDLLKGIYRSLKGEKSFFKVLKSWVIEIAIFVIIISAGSYFLTKSFTDKPIYSVGDTAMRYVKNRDILLNYEAPNEEVASLAESIKDKYGISVYVNIDPIVLYAINGHSCTTGIDPDSAVHILEMIDSKLSLYNEMMVKILPRQMFIVNEIYRGEKQLSAFNAVYVIAFSEATDERTVDHEFFHTLNMFMDKSHYESFVNNTEACSLTSDYACSSTEEFLSEAWAETVQGEMTNEHIVILNDIKYRFLKGGDN